MKKSIWSWGKLWRSDAEEGPYQPAGSEEQLQESDFFTKKNSVQIIPPVTPSGENSLQTFQDSNTKSSPSKGAWKYRPKSKIQDMNGSKPKGTGEEPHNGTHLKQAEEVARPTKLKQKKKKKPKDVPESEQVPVEPDIRDKTDVTDRPSHFPRRESIPPKGQPARPKTLEKEPDVTEVQSLPKKLRWKLAIAKMREDLGVVNLDDDPGPIVDVTVPLEADGSEPFYLCYWCFRKVESTTQHDWHTIQGIKKICKFCKEYLLRKRTEKTGGSGGSDGSHQPPKQQWLDKRLELTKRRGEFVGRRPWEGDQSKSRSQASTPVHGPQPSPAGVLSPPRRGIQSLTNSPVKWNTQVRTTPPVLEHQVPNVEKEKNTDPLEVVRRPRAKTLGAFPSPPATPSQPPPRQEVPIRKFPKFDLDRNSGLKAIVISSPSKSGSDVNYPIIPAATSSLPISITSLSPSSSLTSSSSSSSSSSIISEGLINQYKLSPEQSEIGATQHDGQRRNQKNVDVIPPTPRISKTETESIIPPTPRISKETDKQELNRSPKRLNEDSKLTVIRDHFRQHLLRPEKPPSSRAAPTGTRPLSVFVPRVDGVVTWDQKAPTSDEIPINTSGPPSEANSLPVSPQNQGVSSIPSSPLSKGMGGSIPPSPSKDDTGSTPGSRNRASDTIAQLDELDSGFMKDSKKAKRKKRDRLKKDSLPFVPKASQESPIATPAPSTPSTPHNYSKLHASVFKPFPHSQRAPSPTLIADPLDKLFGSSVSPPISPPSKSSSRSKSESEYHLWMALGDGKAGSTEQQPALPWLRHYQGLDSPKKNNTESPRSSDLVSPGKDQLTPRGQKFAVMEPDEEMHDFTPATPPPSVCASPSSVCPSPRNDMEGLIGRGHLADITSPSHRAKQIRRWNTERDLDSPRMPDIPEGLEVDEETPQTPRDKSKQNVISPKRRLAFDGPASPPKDLSKSSAKSSMEVRVGHKVVSVDSKKKTLVIQTPDGQEIQQKFDKLIMASGSNPLISSLNNKGVYALPISGKTSGDVRDTSKGLGKDARVAVVLGGGFNGLQLLLGTTTNKGKVITQGVVQSLPSSHPTPEAPTPRPQHQGDMHGSSTALEFLSQSLNGKAGPSSGTSQTPKKNKQGSFSLTKLESPSETPRKSRGQPGRESKSSQWSEGETESSTSQTTQTAPTLSPNAAPFIPLMPVHPVSQMSQHMNMHLQMSVPVRVPTIGEMVPFPPNPFTMAMGVGGQMTMDYSTESVLSGYTPTIPAIPGASVPSLPNLPQGMPLKPMLPQSFPLALPTGTDSGENDESDETEYEAITIDTPEATLVSRCLTRKGSVSIQQMIYTHPHTTREFKRIFSVLSQSHLLPQLMTHAYAHYVIELLSSMCSEGQLILLIQNLRPHLSEIASHPIGGVCMGTLLANVRSVKQTRAWLAALSPHIPFLLSDKYGHQLLSTFLERFPAMYTQVVDRYLTDLALCRSVCVTIPGREVLNTLIRVRLPMEIAPVLLRIATMTRELIHNQVGHTVIMSAFLTGSELVSAAILREMEGRFLSLCLQTYSSLVVAECLKVCNEMWRNIIITEISDFNEARALLTNPSGTYVVQVALSVANKDQVMRIMMALRTHLPRLKPKTRAFWNRTFKQAWKRCTGGGIPTNLQPDEPNSGGSGGDKPAPTPNPSIPTTNSSGDSNNSLPRSTPLPRQSLSSLPPNHNGPRPLRPFPTTQPKKERVSDSPGKNNK